MPKQQAKRPAARTPQRLYKLPLFFDPQPEGGYTVTSPVLPGLVTEGDSVEDALANARDALIAVLELYVDTGKPLPKDIPQNPDAAIQADCIVAIP